MPDTRVDSWQVQFMFVAKRGGGKMAYQASRIWYKPTFDSEEGAVAFAQLCIQNQGKPVSSLPGYNWMPKTCELTGGVRVWRKTTIKQEIAVVETGESGTEGVLRLVSAKVA